MSKVYGAVCFGLALLLLPLAEAGRKKGDASSKEALQELQEYIGSWQNKQSRESVNWSWRFKGSDVWLSFDMTGSKKYKAGEVRFLSDKAKYQVTLITPNGEKQNFLGEIKKSVLVVERTNPESMDTEQFKINTAADGDRLVYSLYVRPEGRTVFNQRFQTGYTREGVTFGSEPGIKKPECVVTGGLGTMTVSYMGMTYYVCCTGCRDAFNENPAKIIAEYQAKKKAGKS